MTSTFSFYIATGLDNREDFARCRAALLAAGGRITFDWSDQEPVGADEQDTRTGEVLGHRANDDLDGVIMADVVVKLLPGNPPRFKSSGRGSHTEMGAALGSGVPVVLVSPDDYDQLSDSGTGRLCVFYHHRGILKRHQLSEGPQCWDEVAAIVREIALSPQAVQLQIRALYHQLHRLGMVRVFQELVFGQRDFCPACRSDLPPIGQASHHKPDCPLFSLQVVWMHLFGERSPAGSSPRVFSSGEDHEGNLRLVLTWVDEVRYPPPSSMAAALELVRQGLLLNDAPNPLRADANATWKIPGWVDKGRLKVMLQRADADWSARKLGDRISVLNLIRGVALIQCSACSHTFARGSAPDGWCPHCGQDDCLDNAMQFVEGGETFWVAAERIESIEPIPPRVALDVVISPSAEELDGVEFPQGNDVLCDPEVPDGDPMFEDLKPPSDEVIQIAAQGLSDNLATAILVSEEDDAYVVVVITDAENHQVKFGCMKPPSDGDKWGRVPMTAPDKARLSAWSDKAIPRLVEAWKAIPAS